jgi:hypothetical protein
MTRTSKKLVLQKQTLRALGEGELDAAGGAALVLEPIASIRFSKCAPCPIPERTYDPGCASRIFGCPRPTIYAPCF